MRGLDLRVQQVTVDGIGVLNVAQLEVVCGGTAAPTPFISSTRQPNCGACSLPRGRHCTRPPEPRAAVESFGIGVVRLGQERGEATAVPNMVVVVYFALRVTVVAGKFDFKIGTYSTVCARSSLPQSCEYLRNINIIFLVDTQSLSV